MPYLSRLSLRAEGRDERPSGVRAGGHCTEMLEHELIPANVALFFEEEFPGHRVDVDDVRDGGLSELQEDEGTRHAWVCARIERDDLEGEVRHLRHLDQVSKLALHDG